VPRQKNISPAFLRRAIEELATVLDEFDASDPEYGEGLLKTAFTNLINDGFISGDVKARELGLNDLLEEIFGEQPPEDLLERAQTFDNLIDTYGGDDWRTATFTGSAAIERKRRRIVSLSRTVTRLWERLHPVFQSQYDVSIRRELQRLRLLEEGVPIPPTRVLDDRWRVEGSSSLFEFRNSIEQLHPYTHHPDAPDILKRAF
jgi:PAS domain-containing protein